MVTKVKKKDSIDVLLSEKGKNYGTFSTTALLSQQLKSTIRLSPNYTLLAPEQRESLDMICTKISRILSGNPDLKDSWVDIEGYAHLISERLSDPVSK